MQPSVIIRAAIDADVATITTIIHAAFAEQAHLDPPSGAVGETTERVRERLALGDVFLAEINDVPVGCIACEPREDHFYVGRLAVLAEHRRHGIGAALIEHAEQQAREQNFSRVRLGVRVALPKIRARYESLGYRAVEERSHAGYDTPTWTIMEKILRVTG